MGARIEQDEDIISGINITPMVDIMLVLLIIFMLTASVIEDRSIKVELPEAATGSKTEATVLTIVIDSERTWYLDGLKTDAEGIRSVIRGAQSSSEELEAVIAADKAVPYGEVVQVIDLVKQEGVVKFALNTDPASAEIPAPTTPPVPPEEGG